MQLLKVYFSLLFLIIFRLSYKCSLLLPLKPNHMVTKKLLEESAILNIY